MIARRLFRGLSDGRYYIPRRGPIFSLGRVAFCIGVGAGFALAILYGGRP